MTRNIDNIIDSAQYTIITIRTLCSSITWKVRPVTPIFTLWILTVFLIVSFNIAVTISPYGLKSTGPRILYTNVTSYTTTFRYCISIFIVNHRMYSRHRRTSTTRFHRVDSRHCATQKPSCLSLPPSIHNSSFTFANNIVVPTPHLNRLTNCSHMLKLEIIFLWFVRPRFAQHTYRSRCCMENVYA